jgi:hypothetical protein
MQKELLQQAMAMLDTPEKWNSLRTLSDAREEIRNAWYLNLKTSVDAYFCDEKNRIDKWSYISSGQFHYKWYLRDYGDLSFCLWLHDGYIFMFWVNPSVHDSPKITELLQTDNKFSPLLASLRNDQLYNGDRKIVENGNFSFGSPYDNHFTSAEELAWYAGNRAEEFLEQIVEKVDGIRRNEHLTDLLTEINKLTKK